MANEKLSEVAFRYTCELCDCKCGNKTNFDKHLYTNKHMNNLMANNNAKKNDNMANNNNLIEKDKRVYVCKNCNNEYAHQSSLCKHKKSCKPRENIQMVITPVAMDDSASLRAIIIELIKSNSELQAQQVKSTSDLQKQIFELCKNGTNIREPTVP